MILMRTLRKDYARYSKEDDVDEMVSVREVQFKDELCRKVLSLNLIDEAIVEANSTS